MSEGLGAKHMLYDRTIPVDEQIRRIKAILARSPNAVEFLDAEVCLANYLHRQCWLMGVSPLWILISFQREQSLLTKAGNVWAFTHAGGVVGQDQAGTANVRWDGLPMQIMMAARSVAWSMGFIDAAWFGPKELWPSWRRYRSWPFTNPVPLYGAAGVPLLDAAGQRVCKACADPFTYAQYVFTPHDGVDAENFQRYQERLADVWPV